MSLSGLIFGSIVPDFDLLFRLNASRFHFFQYDVPNILFVMTPIAVLLKVYFDLFAAGTYKGIAAGTGIEPLSSNAMVGYWRERSSSLLTLILSVIAGILLHLSADYISHWNAGLITLYIYYLFGPDNIICYMIYYTTWYLPQLLLTVIGLRIIMEFVFPGMEIARVWQLIRTNISTYRTFYLTFLLIAITFTAAKFACFGYETSHGFDFAVIYTTGGIIFAALSTPVLYDLMTRISRISK